MQVLNEIQNSRSDLYQPLPQETQPQNETELHRALRELGTPDWLNDYVLEPYIRHSGNLVSGMGDTFVRGWLNVSALAMRGLGMASEGLLGGQSMFTSGANWLNDVDADYTKLSEAYRQGLTGNNPTFWDNVVHGTDTSLGYMLYGIGTGGLSNALGANSLTSNIIRFLTQNVSEAMTEAGNTASELYAQDKTRGNDAFWAGMYSLAPNAGIDLLQGVGEGHLETYLDNHFFPGTNGFWWQLAREFGKNLIREETNELLQEPRQQAIETAVKNTFNSGDMSLGNLLGNFGQEARRMLPYKDEQDNLHYGYFADVFPETAASTLLTSLITAPFGGAGGNHQTQIDQHNNEIARKLTDRRDELQREVNDAYLRNQNDETIDPSILEKEAELKNINNALAEYASYANRHDLGINGGQDVQDDAGFDLFADTRGDVQTMAVPTIDTQQETPAMNVPLTDTQQVQNFMPNSSTVGAEEGAKTYRDIHPNEQQLTIPDYAPMSPEQIENNPIAAFLGNLNETNTQAVNNQQAVQEDFVDEDNNDEDNNDISGTFPQQEIQQTNQASWLNIFPEGNIARVRTIKGTEADVRYRIVDADSLITSTNDTGAPNADYPQELQPRQRNREASHEQIIKMSGNLDPELLAESRLASNGAPIIGNDGVVESGNGRIMTIRRAYRYGTGENYRNWLMNNSGRFGINPDTISEIRNPVLVRERITDVDRVKFTREANESSTSQMSMTEHAVNDAQSITPEMLTLFDPEKTLQANHDFISAFSSIVPQSEHGDFYQQNGKISKSGLERIQNALMAKAYNDTGILNRLNEIFDDDIKNVSNALLQAAPKLAVFENGGYSPEISIRDDIVKAVHTLAQLRQEGSSVEDFMSQIQMFGDISDISDEAKTLLQFFDRNKRSAKRIAKGLIHYADSAMNEAKQGQGLIFADSARDKSAILEEAIRIAEAKDADTYNQLANNSLLGKAKSWVTGLLGRDNTNINHETGIGTSTAADPEHHIGTMLYQDGNGKTHTLSIRSDEFNDNYQNEKKYFGRYLEFSDENGNIVARFSPYTKKLQMADSVQNSDTIKNAIVQEFNRNGRNHLQSFGYFDATGKLIQDGNEGFRHKYRTRQDTTPKGKNTHPDNSDTRQRKKRKDSRSLWRRFNDTRKEKAKYEPVRQKVQQTIHEQLEKVAQAQEYEGQLEAKRTAENEGTPYSGSLELTENDKARIHENTRIYAEQYSHVITARLNAAAHLAGMSVDDYHKLWNLRIQADIDNSSNKRGNVEFKYNEDLHRAETIIHLTKSANTSTVLHEFAHIFLKDFQDLVASVDELPEKVRKDWLYLTQWLGISDIDPKSTHKTRSLEENDRWQNAQEKFAVAFEQYYMTGKAPKSRLKRVFQYFKQWLSHVYGAVRNIRYQGSDGYTHEVELSPQVKAIFDRMLKDVPYVPSSESRRARLERAGNNQHGEGFYNQTVSSQAQTIDTNENGENEQSKLRLNLPFDPNELRTEAGHSIENAAPSEMIVTPEGSQNLGYIPENIAEFPAGAIRANAGAVLHAENRHGEQIRGMGYDNAKELLLDVVNNYSHIRRGNGKALLLSARGDANHSAMGVVELVDDNGVYRVKTLRVTRDRYLKNKELLFTRSEPNATGPDTSLTFSSEHNHSQGTFGLYARQSSNLSQSVTHEQKNVNTTDNGISHIRRSNNTFISPSDIEHFDQLALHGTGYTISNNKFGLEFIGSGEGHQSFGYGIYFAQNLEVAEHYRRTGLDNSNATFTFKFAKGQPISLTISELQNKSDNLTQNFDLPKGVTLEGLFDALKELYYDYYDNQNNWDFKKAKRRVLKELQAALSSKYTFSSVTAISNTISALKSMKKLDISGIQHGNIYFADIPESNVLLDWDAEKQNEHVQKSIQKVISKLYDIGAANADIEAFANSHTGKDFYYNLRDVLEPFIKDDTLPFQFHGKNITRSDMAASLLLNQGGIPGLTYFDGWSRYDKQGTHNFVIWNTDMIKLLGLDKYSDNDAKQYFRDTARSKGNRSSENYDQIIGIGGARRLDEAENTTLRMDNLKLARRMERLGLTPKKLWLATGWMKGKEGKWRYELPDGKLLNKNLRELHKLYGWLLDVQKKSNEMSSYTLSPSEKRQYNRIENYDSSLHTLFDAPELFEAYPDLRNIKVYFDDLGKDTSAVYNSVSDNIILNHSIQSAQEIRKSIIHELQHAIQMREGFAAGSNISLDDDRQFNKARNELERLIGSLDKPSADKVRDVLNEKFFGSSIRAFFKAASLSDNEYNVYDEAKLPASVMKQRRDYIFKEYERHAGETEARNTETRSDWSDTKRRSTPLDASEDISRDEQIIGRLPHRSSYSKGFATQDDIERFNQIQNHATGHIIFNNQFDLKYVGSGEGTQVFGHGIYFAENPRVSETYRRSGLKIGSPITKVTMKNGQQFHIDSDSNWYDEVWKLGGIDDDTRFALFSLFGTASRNLDKSPEDIKRKSIEDLEERIALLGRKDPKSSRGIEIINSISSIELSDSPKGNIYNVNIPENFELLDWDIPISKQPEMVKANIADMLQELKRNGYSRRKILGKPAKRNISLEGIIDLLKDMKNGDITGGALYQNIYNTFLSEELGSIVPVTMLAPPEVLAAHRKASEKTSALFNDFGIPGHRYFDLFSRGKQSGTHNFVIWNTDRLKIVGVEGDKEAVDYFRSSILQKLTGNPSETYNQIIGRHGAEDIDKKNGNNWLIDNLKMAQSLTERGFKPKTIRRATGWELGNDNEWKYELQDGNINVPELWDAFQNNNETLPFSVTLEKLYNNSELFDAYPELKNLPVEFTLDLPQGVLGLYSHDYFDNTKRFIQLNPMKHIGELQSTLIHEIQHAVQFIEGFAEGGEGKDILIQGNVAMSIAEKQKDALLAIASDNIKKAVSLYNNGMQRKADRLVQSLSQKEKIKWERIKPILDSIHNGQFRLYNSYNYLGGEIEARNVQNRAGFSPEQRRNTLLADTQDNNDWLVSKNGFSQNFGIVHEYSNNNEIYSQNTETDRQIDAANLAQALEISRKQLNEVAKKYHGTEHWLKAPNGNKTNLSEKQWLQVRTENFKRWFGDWENNPQNASKVLDKNGEPLVVTHIVRGKGGFSTFNTDGTFSIDSDKTSGTGAWFANLKGKENISLKTAGIYNASEGKNIYHVFLNLRNPFVFDAEGKRWQRVGKVWIENNNGDIIDYDDYAGKVFSNLRQAQGYIKHNFGDNTDYHVMHTDFQTSDDLVRFVREGKLGDGNHDGVIIKNLRDMSVWNVDDYIVFAPNDIKSAVRNNGEYSSSNDEIYAQTVELPHSSEPQAEKALEKYSDILQNADPNKINPDNLIDGSHGFITPDILEKYNQSYNLNVDTYHGTGHIILNNAFALSKSGSG
ncbi:MAG: hypothetical protein IJ587_04960 [Synergistaceae bacterium]|nr:hypothetical protein [Synergistaceae bacterium]